MTGKSRNFSKFKSETEEAECYATPAGRQQTQRAFARALRAGTLISSSGSKAIKTDPKQLEHLMELAKENATRAISIRISIADLERAKQVAEKSGVGYQTVLKRAIRDGLKRAG